MLLGPVACEIGARCNTVVMVITTLEQRLFHLVSALDGSIVVHWGKLPLTPAYVLCCMVYGVCVYEIWLSVLDSSFVTQLGKIAGLWSMGYGVCKFISDPLFLNLVLAHKTFHTAHVWKYKAQCEHLLTLGAHAQRGLQYLVCHSVLSVRTRYSSSTRD